MREYNVKKLLKNGGDRKPVGGSCCLTEGRNTLLVP